MHHQLRPYPFLAPLCIPQHKASLLPRRPLCCMIIPMPTTPTVTATSYARHEVRKFQRILRVTLARRSAIIALSAGFWLCGTITLVARLSGWHGTFATRLSLLCATGIVAAIGTALWSLRRPISEAASRAFIDAASAAGGLIMCADTAGAALWQFNTPRLPQVSWNRQRHTIHVTLASFFAVAAATLPSYSFTTSHTSPQAGLTPLIDDLTTRLTQAASADLLPEPVLAALSNQLSQAMESSKATDPARTLEALDHISSELTREAAANAAAVVTQQEALQAAMALTKHLAANAADLMTDPTRAAAISSALSQFFNQTSLPANLTSNLLSTCNNSGATLNAETLAALAAHLNNAATTIDSRMLQLADLNMLNPSLCNNPSATANAAACNAALAQLLSQDDIASGIACELADIANIGGLDGLCAQSACAVGAVSAGLPTHGPGAAHLTWTTPTSPDGITFQELPLTSHALSSPEQAELIALSAAAPKVPDTPHAVDSGALNNQTTPASGSTPQTPLLPRHRAAVAHFFD